MAKIDVQTEQEAARGWWYRVLIIEDDGQQHAHDVRLDWLDHEHWSGGRVPPSRVVHLLMECLQERAVALPPRFDASTARQWSRDLDEKLHAQFAPSESTAPKATEAP